MTAIGSAGEYLTALVVGPVAGSLAVMAIAAVGFALLSGRMDVPAAARVVAGCFILIGSAGLAAGLMTSTASGPVPPMASEVIFESTPERAPATVPSPTVPARSDPFSPYAQGR